MVVPTATSFTARISHGRVVRISDTVLLQIRSRSNEKPVVPVASFSYTRIG